MKGNYLNLTVSRSLLTAGLTLVSLVTFFIDSVGRTQIATPGQDSASGYHLRQEGQLLTVSLTRGSPIRIFVAGKEEAKLDPSTLKVTVRRLKPYPGKVLTTDRLGNDFTVQNQEELTQASHLEVITQVKTKTEVFHFELKPALP